MLPPPPQAICSERNARVKVSAPKATQPRLRLYGAGRLAFTPIAAPIVNNQAIKGMTNCGLVKVAGTFSQLIGCQFEGGARARAVVRMVSVD